MALVTLALVQTMRWSFVYHGLGRRWYDALTSENGVWETLTAITLFIAGVVLIRTVKKYGDSFGLKFAKWPSRVLGLALIFAAGEELSWGQHWFGFATPGLIDAVNAQHEFNLHNMNSHWANHLMVVFFLGYVGLLPLLGWLLKDVRYACERLQIPQPPYAFVPFAVIGSLMSDHGMFSVLWGYPPWCPSEARETLFGIAMLGLSILFNLKQRLATTAAGLSKPHVYTSRE
jgi:hypothetical protein